MKVFTNIVKVLTALAAVAGAVYVVATYGDQIVAWAKKMLSSMPKCPACEEAETVVEAEAAPAGEDAPAEEAAEEAPVEEPAAEEVVVEENEPVAEEGDFEA